MWTILRTSTTSGILYDSNDIVQCRGGKGGKRDALRRRNALPLVRGPPQAVYFLYIPLYFHCILIYVRYMAWCFVWSLPPFFSRSDPGSSWLKLIEAPMIIWRNFGLGFVVCRCCRRRIFPAVGFFEWTGLGSRRRFVAGVVTGPCRQPSSSEVCG